MNKLLKKLSTVLAIVTASAVCLTSCQLFGVGGSISYSGKTLEEGQVGVQYDQSVATATAEGAMITYALEAGDTLPDGLTLSSGKVTGIPTEAVNAHTFTVVASAEGYSSISADFSITIKAGELVYADSEVKVEINKESTATIATATGASNITYTLKQGSVLPEGLTLNADGTISGMATELNEGVQVTVVASASGLASVEAEITVKVVNPILTFEGATAATGRAGEFYTYVVAVTDTVKATYKLKEGSELPAGLSLTQDGLIMGTPEGTANAVKFTVVASANNYESAEAVFTISIRRANDVSEMQSSVTAGETPTFVTGYEEAIYLSNAPFNAEAGNGNVVTYTLKDGSTIPAGLTLYANGTVYGTPEKKGTYTFTVVASASACTSVEIKCSIKIEAKKIVYDSEVVTPATKGVAYSYSVAKAVTSDGTPVTYSVGKRALPDGLTLSANGMVTGTPTNYANKHYFSVIASAEGYTSKEATFSITIMDEVQELKDGILEAEYTNMDGYIGAGWSGGTQGTGMLQESPLASNGWYIGWTHIAQVYSFTFNASEASTAKLSIRLGSELGAVTLDQSIFVIKVNGVEVNYGSLTLPASDTSSGATAAVGAFQLYELGKNVALVEGENVITVEVKDNKLLMQGTGRTGGPSIDCFKIESTATLTYQPYSFNIS